MPSPSPSTVLAAWRSLVQRRFTAAKDLEKARQVIRESQRYGYAVTQQHTQAVHDAELEYDQATRNCAVVWR